MITALSNICNCPCARSHRVSKAFAVLATAVDSLLGMVVSRRQLADSISAEKVPSKDRKGAGPVTDEEINDFAAGFVSEDMQQKGYTEEDAYDVKEKLRDWRDRYTKASQAGE